MAHLAKQGSQRPYCVTGKGRSRAPSTTGSKSQPADRKRLQGS